MKNFTVIFALGAFLLLLQGCGLLPTFETYEDYRGDWYEQDVKDAAENME